MDNRQVFEELQRARTLVTSLAKEIDVKNQRLLEMEQNCDEISANLRRLKMENSKLNQIHSEEMRKVQFVGQQNAKLQRQLESLMNDFEQFQQRVKQLERQEAESKLERRKLLWEKEKLEAQSYIPSNSELAIMVDNLRKELAEKVDELQCMDSLNQTLILKEHMSNNELQDARKELISARDLQDLWNDQTVGIKRMGAVDEKPFQSVCRQKFSKDWEMKSMELTSLWQNYVNNPNWHPFKNETIDGKLQEIIDKDDSKLKELRSTWGEGAYGAVADALSELNEYNSSGRYVVPELWNFKVGRRAFLKEVIQYIIQEMKCVKSHKRRR